MNFIVKCYRNNNKKNIKLLSLTFWKNFNQTLYLIALSPDRYFFLTLSLTL